MKTLSKLTAHRTGLWLVLGAVLVVAGWRLCIIASQHHLLAVAREVGSIGLSKEGLFNEELIPNHDGTQVIFYQETETGVGTYLCEPASGKIQMLFEQKEKGYSLHCGMLGWSPDGRYFAAGIPANVEVFDYVKSIVVYDAKTVTPVFTVSGDGFSWDSKFIWLSDNSFAWTTHNQTWLVYGQMPNGNWQQTQVVKKFGDGSGNESNRPFSAYGSLESSKTNSGLMILRQERASKSGKPKLGTWIVLNLTSPQAT